MSLLSADEVRTSQKLYVSEGLQLEFDAIEQLINVLETARAYIYYTPRSWYNADSILNKMISLGYTCRKIEDQRDGNYIEIKW